MVKLAGAKNEDRRSQQNLNTTTLAKNVRRPIILKHVEDDFIQRAWSRSDQN